MEPAVFADTALRLFAVLAMVLANAFFVGAAAGAWWLRSQLYGVAPWDPMSLAATLPILAVARSSRASCRRCARSKRIPRQRCAATDERLGRAVRESSSGLLDED